MKKQLKFNKLFLDKSNKSYYSVCSILNGIRIAPRKIRLIANIIRYKKVEDALCILRYTKKQNISICLSKLIISTISNWNRKQQNIQHNELFIHKIMVNQGKMLKRIRPVPQGRGHKIRKKSSNIIICISNQYSK
ncbi:50S ribosomal protein L22 [Blattabacterium cuenoti]|uniref:50S ribosomal protein L22 n=1 Tax=Blattabacterium cuenoti TaxID=1653831 RepID=UPI00163BA9CA|nr:50S ribosomal protein L22 [Blattabacterium cuenoti]